MVTLRYEPAPDEEVPLKITEIRTHLCYSGGDRNWVFTEILTDEGITGVSEVGMNKETAIVATIQELTQYLIGEDPTRIEAHWHRLYRGAHWLGTLLTTAISAVEAAMWDILGQWLNAPVYKLLGGPTRDAVRVYRPVAPRSWRKATVEERIAEARRLVSEEGYTALKTGVAARGRFPGDGLSIADLDAARAYIGGLRDAVGPQVDLMLDCSGRYTPAEAIRLIRALEEFHLMFVEEPVPPENIEALALVARSVGTPIATGERILTRHGFAPIVAQQAVAVIQPDVTNTGGIAETRKIAAMAETAYMTVAPHNPNALLATAMNIHVAASIPNFLILELPRAWPEDLARMNEFVTPGLEIRNGYLQLPTGPGLGLKLNREALARHPYKPPPYGEMA
ncbi:MAG: mandelate racemase/muconate lactonizing enzyme family protein [Anaerolineae bacterium]|nr:mandelate racemase/muconate lactonizing enzyme family protein [Anaerolineae bacterium]